ncbi:MULTISPECIES: GlxA family transcriptional regulator [unclassified Duganella]|uniref:GlxA family transcriptional regulator n=1 Tax=unclassified Duganella TaxID=2636909 RepID=UPI00087EB2E3|nr:MULTISPECIES: DJ-1/PfpI family protein [unclassified Duganella]SDF75317.1 transcriptional regulator, AraC family with amidase-like domain [Duganella sp. OV458]SDI54272.1 transcriptional regulator, AraC family with amidase-like domain [Duganella sp. OV510]
MNLSSSQPAITVDIVVYPGFKAMEAIGPMSVFEYANLHLQRRGKAPGYDVRIASYKTGMVRSDTLMSLDATKALNPLALPDNAIIVGARHIQQAMAESAAITDWVAAVAPRIKLLTALCSGAFFLAAAGVLDGKRATTHWSVAERLQAEYPAIEVDADAIFIRSDNVWTSAGVTAGIDLALALVEEDYGRDLALEVATEMVVYLKRPGGQSQFSAHLRSERTTRPNIRELQNWILDHLQERLSVSQLAQKAMMSERHFARVFQQEVGLSVQEFIEMCRFERATQLLADLALPLKSVAARACFTDEAHMRRVFIKKLGITPKVYRERFATTGA